MAQSEGWQVGADFQLAVQPVVWNLVPLHGVLGLPQSMAAMFQEQASHENPVELCCPFGLWLGNSRALCQTWRAKTQRPTSQWAKFQSHWKKSRIGDTKYCRYFWKILSFPIFIMRMEINLRPLDKKNKRYTPFTQSKKIKILRS